MNDAVARIRDNSFRVDIENYKGSIEYRGTAFATSPTTVVTAYHVVELESKKPANRVFLTGYRNDRYEGKVETVNEDADLARVTLLSDFATTKPFDTLEPPPEIGKSCIWGGYPILIGERNSHRLRFARGMVSSEIYGGQKRRFFELDGAFSPGHSGSAVVDSQSSTLVGVVSRSAGELLEFFEKARTTFMALDAIQTGWKIFEDSMRQLENISDHIDYVSRELEEQGLLPEDIRTSPRVSDSWGHSLSYFLPKEVKGILELHGITIHEGYQRNLIGTKHQLTTLMAQSDVVWKAVIDLLQEWTTWLSKAVDDSLQMGIGIASCEDPLEKILL